MTKLGGRLVMRLRLAIVRVVCRALLPRNVWIGKQFGAYTQRWDILLGRLDSRGVLQGVLDRDVGITQKSAAVRRPVE